MMKRLLKKILHTENLTLYIHKRRKWIFRKIYRKKFTTHDLMDVLKSMGMKEGSVVFIHSSMTEFYNFQGTAEELINSIIDVIGSSGTLLMPAYPKCKFAPERDLDNPEWIDFDVNTTPSGAGYLTEVFRNYPGVKRSINIQHSVCAYGYLAGYFVSEHHLSVTAWDEYSPYYKLFLKDALIFKFGLPHLLPTVHHCTESLLRTRYTYFQHFFNSEVEYRYRDAEGNVAIQRMLFPALPRKRKKKKVIECSFDKSQFKKTAISNLHIEMFRANHLLQTLLNQAEEGKVIYKIPSPKSFMMCGKLLKVDRSK